MALSNFISFTLSLHADNKPQLSLCFHTYSVSVHCLSLGLKPLSGPLLPNTARFSVIIFLVYLYLCAFLTEEEVGGWPEWYKECQNHVDINDSALFDIGHWAEEAVPNERRYFDILGNTVGFGWLIQHTVGISKKKKNWCAVQASTYHICLYYHI